MKTKILANHVCKFTTSHRKEGKCYFSGLSVVSMAAKPNADGRLDPVISLRLYGTGNRNYACLWAGERRGSGWAGGYGYHRPSAAASEAIRNAGFQLDRDIAGVGSCAINKALMSIAKALKVKRPALVEAYA